MIDKQVLRNFIVLVFLVTNSMTSFSQSFSDDKTSMANFLRRAYNNSPFEGVKVVEDYKNKYFISVLSLEKSKYGSLSIMMRAAQVKAQAQANVFFNGSNISSDIVIKTTEQVQNTNSLDIIVETIEIIREHSTGFVKQMELLTNFEEGKRIVFIFCKELKVD